MRAAWTQEELRGHELVRCAVVTWAGRVLRMATRTLELDDDVYPPTMQASAWSRRVALFDLLDIPDELGISGWLEGDLVELYRQGHRLLSARVEVFDVRIRPDGSTPDTYARRRRLISGILRDGTLGVHVQGRTFVSGTVYVPWPQSTATIPLATEEISRSTWRWAAMADSDEGVCYPIIIGYPGRDDYNPERPLPATQVAWISRARRTWQTLCVGMGALDATTIRLIHAANPEGWDVATSTDYSPYDGSSGTGTPEPAIDRNGVAVTVVDFNAEGYSDSGSPSYIDPANYPAVADAGDTNQRVYMAFTAAGGGGISWRGKLLRGAGDVLAWSLERTGWPVDWGRVEAAIPSLDTFLIDAAITVRMPAVEWLTGSLLPLLPVSLKVGPLGIYPLVWRQASGDEATVLDVDTNLRLWVGDHQTEEADTLVNVHTLRYGYSALTDGWRYTARVGPESVATTDLATGTILTQEQAPDGSGSYGRLAIEAVDPGIDGTAWVVDFTVSGAGAAPVENLTTKVVTLDAQDGVDTAETLADAINAGLTKVRATATGDLTIKYSVTAPDQSISLKLRDFGVEENPTCRRSWLQLRETGTGIEDARRSADLETYIVYDHPTARAVLAWRAAAYGSARRRVVIAGAESEMGHLDLLAPVKVTAADLGFDGVVGWVEEIVHYSDGEMAVTVVFLDR